ncbi:MAG: hypothetical protein KDD67_08075 [Ignavibacteriae bacterium]|nr:hypothetical protein [Ignavibacteriota bacterium]MCB9215953.1 hypothetical protein [Ignavibacteria bacterium]
MSIKSVALFFLLFCFSAGAAYAQGGGPGTNGSSYYLKTIQDSVGYLAGWSFSEQVKREGPVKPVLNYRILIAGAEDALKYLDAKLTLGQVDQIVESVRQKLEEIYEKQDSTVDIPKVIYGTPTNNLPDRIKARNDSVSYAIGYNFGYSIRSNNRSLNPVAVSVGLSDCLNGNTSQLTDDDILALQIRMQQERLAEKEGKEQSFLKQRAMLDENANRPEVKKLPSGIQYEVLEEGKGNVADEKASVSIHIVAYKWDEASPYYNSRTTDQPLIYNLSETSDEWVTILTQMPVGAIWKLWIPPDAVSDPDMAAKAIPETLIMEVEMISINGKE